MMRVLVLFDGQNLYHSSRKVWGPRTGGPASPYTWPSYDATKLAQALVARVPGRTLAEIRFYTGVPNPGGDETQKFWHGFWINKLRSMQNQGIYVYRGSVNVGGQEKGVDVSLSIDLVQATYEQRYEVAIIVSQDTDFGPAVRLAKTIARNQGRQLAYESAFPVGPGSRSQRGVPGTNWVPIDQATYDACLDPADYRPKRG